MPIGIPDAAHDRMIFFNQQFPATERQVSKDESAAMSSVAELSIKHDELAEAQMTFPLRILYLTQ